MQFDSDQGSSLSKIVRKFSCVACVAAVGMLGVQTPAAAVDTSATLLVQKYEADGLPAAIAQKLLSSADGSPVTVTADASTDGTDFHTAVVGPDSAPMYISANTTIDPAAPVESPEDRELGVSYSATAKSVQLAWNAIPGVAEYEIYRDDALVAKVTGTDYLDTAVMPEAAYDYEVTGAALLEAEPVTDPDTGAVTYPDRWASFTGSTPVTVPPASLPKLPKPPKCGVSCANDGIGHPDVIDRPFDPPIPHTPTTTFEYRTFIADKTVPGNPCVLWPVGAKFAGDDRGYSATSQAYRTQMRATAIWGAPSQLSSSKQVGESHLLNRDGSLRDTKRATDEDMHFKQLSLSRTKASFRLDHSATNPFCTHIGGTDRYKVTVALYKNGRWSISGWRRPAPHHEAYIQQGSGSWKTVIKKPSNGILCLTVICGTTRVDAHSTPAP
jgi:hypothetical protein